MDEKLINLIADLKEKETLALVTEKISGGVDPLSLMDDTRKAMEIVGKRFESGDYFLPISSWQERSLERSQR
jgi:methanogenic corrinoid protein MtbC1